MLKNIIYCVFIFITLAGCQSYADSSNLPSKNEICSTDNIPDYWLIKKNGAIEYSLNLIESKNNAYNEVTLTYYPDGGFHAVLSYDDLSTKEMINKSNGEVWTKGLKDGEHSSKAFAFIDYIFHLPMSVFKSVNPKGICLIDSNTKIDAKIDEDNMHYEGKGYWSKNQFIYDLARVTEQGAKNDDRTLSLSALSGSFTYTSERAIPKNILNNGFRKEK